MQMYGNKFDYLICMAQKFSANGSNQQSKKTIIRLMNLPSKFSILN